MPAVDLFTTADAVFDGRHRLRLERTWDASLPRLGWVMLNPSVADAEADDPTIRRCTGYARDWGYGSMIVGNLFTRIETDSRLLFSHRRRNHRDATTYLEQLADETDLIVCAWGALPAARERAAAVAEILLQSHEALYALAINATDDPLHPLRKRKSLTPIVWKSRETQTA